MYPSVTIPHLTYEPNGKGLKLKVSILSWAIWVYLIVFNPLIICFGNSYPDTWSLEIETNDLKYLFSTLNGSKVAESSSYPIKNDLLLISYLTTKYLLISTWLENVDLITIAYWILIEVAANSIDKNLI